MGDHREQIVDISTPAEDAEARATAVREWLETAGWAVPADDSDAADWLYPEEAILTAHPGILARWPGLGGITFVVVPETAAWVAGDGTDVPVCANCGAASGTWEQIEEWDENGADPLAACSECGNEALLGDWNIESSVAMGSVAVVIDPQSAPGGTSTYDPAEIARSLRSELATTLGGRWAYVHHHL